MLSHSHTFLLCSILAPVPLAAALRLREAATDATISSSRFPPQEELHFSSANSLFSPTIFVSLEIIGSFRENLQDLHSGKPVDRKLHQVF